MKKLIAFIVAALFSTATIAPIAFAAEKADKKPTAEECKKDSKIKGCDEVLKQKK